MSRFFQRKAYNREDANSWERLFGKLLTPVEAFTRNSSASGILLIVCTLAALAIANSPWRDGYFHLLHQPVAVSFGEWRLEMSLHHWVNDGLMALFFYLVGLEIKHEVMVGELSSLSQAVLPIIAALGGMVAPALVYGAINAGGVGAAGWGIPMATDIAFAIAVLILLGDRIPTGLVTILFALAIVDDLGAVVVIALFYTEAIQVAPLLAALGCFALQLALNRFGVRKPWPYLLVAIVMWALMLFSGVHATIAGVLGALATPVRSLYNPEEFSREARKLLDKFDIYRRREQDFLESERLVGVLHTLHHGINQAQTPLQRLEHGLHDPVYFLIIPLFAFFNAGVTVDAAAIGSLVSHPVSLGVAAGLLFGKFGGVFGAIWLSVRFGVARLPAGVNFRHICGMGMLAGIGFTMSIFISELAFKGEDLLLNNAKIAILVASVIASLTGFLWLRAGHNGDSHS